MAKRMFFLCVVTHVCKKMSVLKTSGDVQLSLREERSSSAENSQNANFWLTCYKHSRCFSFYVRLLLLLI